MFKKLLSILIIIACLGFDSCAKPDIKNGNTTNSGNSSQVSLTEINGTKIVEGNNLIGLVADETGKGIAGVPVSDGYTFTTTDDNGVYQFKANHYCRKVYISLPAEYEIPLDDEKKMPLFFSTNKIDRRVVNRNDFELRKLANPTDEFTLIAIGDPQCRTSSDVERFTKETMVDLNETVISEQSSGNYLNAFALTLGDIIFDKIEQWDPMVKSLSNVKINDGKYLPIFNCIGNHDHNAAESNDFKATNLYVEKLGPTDYSFNRGKAHIIVMDNVFCTKSWDTTWEYGGGYSEQQINWLKQDLELVKDKQDKVVFFAGHIPFRGGSTKDDGSSINKARYYDEVLTLLEQFHEAHILIGHTHYQQNYIHTDHITKSGKPVYEHIHGAACGAWWSSNLCVDGTPNGYSFYEVKGNTVYNWVAKGTRLPKNHQMRVYNGNDIYTGSQNYSFGWVEGGYGGKGNYHAPGKDVYKNAFVAKIWNCDPSWKVELIVDNKAYPMKMMGEYQTDMCTASFFYNEVNKNSATYLKRLNHFWYCTAPCGDPSKEKNWEVRATQTIPGSQHQNVYSSSSFQKDFSTFAIGDL